MDTVLLTDLVRFAHILAVIIGLGCAFLADLHVFSRRKKPISSGFVDTLKEQHRLVAVALVAMWATGLAMIYIRTGFVLENFTPKLFSKVGVVALLTLNAILIGKIAMPLLLANIGRSPLDLPVRHKIGMVLLSGVSTTSWLLALAMGVSKVLAASPWATFDIVLSAAYLVAVLASVAAVFVIDGVRMMADYYRVRATGQTHACNCDAHRRERHLLAQLKMLRDDLVKAQGHQVQPLRLTSSVRARKPTC